MLVYYLNIKVSEYNSFTYTVNTSI